MISTRFEDRDDKSVTRNYGQLLVDLCSCIPDGILTFISYTYTEQIVQEWDGNEILRQLTDAELLVFIERKMS